MIFYISLEKYKSKSVSILSILHMICNNFPKIFQRVNSVGYLREMMARFHIVHRSSQLLQAGYSFLYLCKVVLVANIIAGGCQLLDGGQLLFNLLGEGSILRLCLLCMKKLLQTEDKNLWAFQVWEALQKCKSASFDSANAFKHFKSTIIR